MAERFVQTLKQECLNHFWLFGEEHLRRALKAWLEHYHSNRPHQGVNNEPPGGLPGEAAKAGVFRLEDVVSEEKLGGLIRHYHRAA